MKKFGIKITKEVFPAVWTPACPTNRETKTTNFSIPLPTSLHEVAEYRAGILPFEHERYIGDQL